MSTNANRSVFRGTIPLLRICRRWTERFGSLQNILKVVLTFLLQFRYQRIQSRGVLWRWNWDPCKPSNSNETAQGDSWVSATDTKIHNHLQDYRIRGWSCFVSVNKMLDCVTVGQFFFHDWYAKANTEMEGRTRPTCRQRSFCWRVPVFITVLRWIALEISFSRHVIW